MSLVLLAAAAALAEAPDQARAAVPAVGRRGSADIVVTAPVAAGQSTGAAKLDLPVVRTPQAVSIVDADFIATLNLRTVAETLNYSAGVRSQAFGSDTRIEYYQLRGFANQNFVKDGLVLFNSGAFLSWTTPAEGIERLEVLKGPSSVLYGGGSAGGLVNIVSKEPVRQPHARIEAGADEYGSAYGSADIGGALSGTLAIRADALVRRGNTQVRLAEDNRTYGAVALGWTPTSDTTLTLRASVTRDRANRPTGFVPYAGFVTPLPDGRRIPIDLFVSDPAVDRYDRDQVEAGYTLEARLSPALRFVSNARYGRIDLVYAGLYGNFTGNPVLAGGRAYLARSNSRQDAWLDNLTIDTHVDGSFRTGPLAHDLLAGIDYAYSSTASTTAMGTAPRLDIFAPAYRVAIPALGPPGTTRQTLDQTGFYLQDQISLGGLTALLSARHDRLGIAAVSAARLATRGDPGKTTWRAGASYLSAIGVAPYLSYATSFAPVVGVEAATGAFYRPETGRSLEAGVKYQARGLPLSATTSLFTITRDGVLVANPVAGFPTNQSQLGRIRSRGGEAEVQARPVPTLILTASLTAFRIENRSGVAAAIGKVPTATPQFTAAAFADYTMPDGGLIAGLGGGVGVRHVGRSFADVSNTLVVPSATVYDASLHYEFGAIRLAANVSNLFNRRYVAACPSAGTCYAANLRRATFSLGTRFGATR